MLSERDYLLYLSSILEIGTMTASHLMKHFGSAERVCMADENEMNLLINGSMADKLQSVIKREEIEERVASYKERLQKEGIGYIMRGDKEYPKLLDCIDDPPEILYFKGNINLLKEKNMIAMVGSRQATIYGREAAELISSQLAAAGVVVVSGLAYGIDTASHRGAIKAKGKTIGVSGCGINIIYPHGNRQLYENMYKDQLVISENGLDVPSYGFNFPLRNRIISGLSRGVVVVEAREKSGSLITAEMALLQGRNVYAIPGRINDPLSKGTNRLIREGATLVDNADVIMEDILGVSGYKPKYEKKEEKNEQGLFFKLSEEEVKVFEAVTTDPVYIDDIVSVSGVAMPRCIAALITLRKAGLIAETERGYYHRMLKNKLAL
ncbi:MAG: DNA-processing protein DprA [Eubacterium sp.]|nr:DNA-processing protein DprA [Eubacterium sp.]